MIYAVGIREGSVEEWDHVWTKSQESNVPAEREMMLEALAQTQKPWLLWRYVHIIYDGLSPVDKNPGVKLPGRERNYACRSGSRIPG